MKRPNINKSSILLIECFLILTILIQGSLVYASSIEKMLMPGPLINGHAKYEDKCKSCHVPFEKKSQRILCLKCHKKINKDIKESRGFHGHNKKASKIECKHCHTDHKGRNIDIVQFDHELFNHDLTDFKLEGVHDGVACSSCHQADKLYREAPDKCNKCHKQSNPHSKELTTEKVCTDCHSVLHKWAKSSFDHDKTDFKLEGKHKKTTCNRCHPKGQYKKTEKKCYSCHRLDNVHGVNYKYECNSCHTKNDWKIKSFDHKNIKTNKDDCYSCHKLDDHHDGRYEKKCDNCHITKEWKKTIYNHDKTKFPLKGQHLKIKCLSCHTGKIYKEKLKISCISCHKNEDEHNKRYGQKCEKCHLTTKWTKRFFDHDKTDFKLKGKHKDTSCQACHKTVMYKEKIKTDCFSCHKNDDIHKNLYGKSCAACHSFKEWKKNTFDHKKTVLVKNPISAKRCPACIEERLGKKCYDCHKSEHIHKKKDKKDCKRCHNVKDWKENLLFEHDLSDFPLIGRHAVVLCEECHPKFGSENILSECISCHKKDDKHKLGLGGKCRFCHNPNGWRYWQFEHKETEFKFDGAHEGLECAPCHKKPVKENEEVKVTGGCYGCHKSDNIHSSGFSKSCKQCHTTKSFNEIRILKP